MGHSDFVPAWASFPRLPRHLVAVRTFVLILVLGLWASSSGFRVLCFVFCVLSFLFCVFCFLFFCFVFCVLCNVFLVTAFRSIRF